MGKTQEINPLNFKEFTPVIAYEYFALRSLRPVFSQSFISSFERSRGLLVLEIYVVMLCTV
jgi:hypothetical protein